MLMLASYSCHYIIFMKVWPTKYRIEPLTGFSPHKHSGNKGGVNWSRVQPEANINTTEASQGVYNGESPNGRALLYYQ